MSSYFHACERCGSPGVEGQFRVCGSCAGKPIDDPVPVSTSTPVTEEEQALLSLEEIRQAERLRTMRIWEAHRLSLRLRSFGQLARPLPK